MIRRYEVHDEDGPLRSFYTRKEAEQFLQDGWRIVVLPKPKRKTSREVFEELMIDSGESKW